MFEAWKTLRYIVGRVHVSLMPGRAWSRRSLEPFTSFAFYSSPFSPFAFYCILILYLPSAT